MSSSLSSGVASREKIVDARLAAMAAAVSGLSPVIITVLDAHAAQLGEALLDAALDDILEMNDPSSLPILRPRPEVFRPTSRSRRRSRHLLRDIRAHAGLQRTDSTGGEYGDAGC